MINKDQLKEIKILKDLDQEGLGALASHMTPIRLEKGGYLFYRDDPSEGIYFVVKGSLQTIIDNEAGKEIIVYTLDSGEIIGELTLFADGERSATVVALEKCRLCKIRSSKFIEMMTIYPSIAINLAQTLVERLKAANYMIERLGTMDGAERVIHYLKSLVIREGMLKGKYYILLNKPTYKQISQRLGVSEKTVYRTMQSLVKTNAAKVNGRQLLVDRELIDSVH